MKIKTTEEILAFLQEQNRRTALYYNQTESDGAAAIMEFIATLTNWIYSDVGTDHE